MRYRRAEGVNAAFSSVAAGNGIVVEASQAAELKSLLEDVALPAEKARLLEYAVQQHAEPAFLGALQQLPDREYRSLDEVVEELLHVQPERGDGGPPEPKEESGAPPGGDAYVDRSPDTGRARYVDQVEAAD